jgi:hypothetical protein
LTTGKPVFPVENSTSDDLLGPPPVLAKPRPGTSITGRYPPRRQNLNRTDWPFCKKCGSRHPPENFVTPEGELRKTCNNCRANRNKRRTGCTCNKCTYCRRKKKLELEAAEKEADKVFSYKYEKWEILGESNAYFLPLRLPLTEIAKLYDFTS